MLNDNSRVFGCSLQQHYTSPKKTNILQCKTQTSLILIRLQFPWHFLCVESMIAASIVARHQPQQESETFMFLC
jgi:hypothetical protein